MKSILLISFFLPFITHADFPKPELSKDFWTRPSFVRSFIGDYGFRSEIEPRINKSEQFVLQEVVAKADNQLEDAITYLESRVDEETSAALDFALATMKYQMGRLTSSAQLYEQAIRKFPSFLRAYKNLGFVYLSLGRHEEATKNLSEAISLGEADGVTYVALGYCNLHMENFISAENAYRMGLVLLQESKDARNGLINCFLYTQRHSEALALLDELLVKEPNDFFCHRARASALLALGEEKMSTVALETLRRMGQLKLSDHIVLGDLYHNLELYDQSLEVYEVALSQKDQLSLSQYIRVARILIGRGSYSEGFAYLDKIENIFGSGYSKKDEYEIRLLQAEVLRVTGKDEEANKLLKQIIAQHPLEGEAFLMLGLLSWKNENYVEAEVHFQRAAQDSKSEVQALIEHARMMVSENQYSKAISLLEKAQSLKPQANVQQYLESINNLLSSTRIKL